MAGAETPTSTEVARRGHDVDGIIFATREDGLIQGAGWQGRGFLFRPEHAPLLATAFQELLDVQGRQKEHHISVKTGGAELNFNIDMTNSWLEATDKEQKVSFAISIADLESMVHVLGELETILAGTDTLADHFCEEFGVEDDD